MADIEVVWDFTYDKMSEEIKEFFSDSMGRSDEELLEYISYVDEKLFASMSEDQQDELLDFMKEHWKSLVGGNDVDSLADKEYHKVVMPVIKDWANRWEEALIAALDEADVPEDAKEEIFDAATSNEAMYDVMLEDEGWTNAFDERPERWEWSEQYGIDLNDLLPGGYGGHNDELTNASSEASYAPIQLAMQLGMNKFIS